LLKFLNFFLLILLGILSTCTPPKESSRPNIIIFYADDLGYGDLSCYGATALNTINIDRLSNEGIRFTNGYATSATCTPSRYALLTGEYPWRNKRAHVLPGNAPLIIDTEKVTLPDQLKKAGYHTGIVGKWHLGLGGENLDWNGRITPGPNEVGFDYSFILASTNDRVPTVYVENDRVTGLTNSDDPLEVNYIENFPGQPTGKDNPELLKLHPSHGHDMSINNGISRIGYMRGGKSAMWIDENMGDTLLTRAVDFIRSNQNQPFFLFYSFPQIHVPRTPHPRFATATGMGPRGDAIIEMDFAVGKVLDLLEELDIDQNTLIIFSSDNGPVLDDGYMDDAITKIGNHKPGGGLRGGKYSLFDGGTRMPFLVRWSGTIQPGTSNALVSQLDLQASLSSLVGESPISNDSENLIKVLLGKNQVGRTDIILEAMGNTAYRRGDFVLIPPYEGSAITEWGPNIETGLSAEYQLYDLKNDPGQKDNLAVDLAEKLEEMKGYYEEFMNQ